MNKLVKVYHKDSDLNDALSLDIVFEGHLISFDWISFKVKNGSDTKEFFTTLYGYREIDVDGIL